MNDLLLTFYGDDFTGSTDVMESLTLGGVPAVLFLQPPSAEFVAERFPHARAVGLAGVSRTMTPAQMKEMLPPLFHTLAALGAPVFHYKVCSTFDSSPTIGSIGCAIDICWEIFAPGYVPLIVGSPQLKRYIAFGNLFARVSDTTYRIDRHPTMSRHPVTPMLESDLRLHLAKQTQRPVGLVDLFTLDRSDADVDAALTEQLDDGAEIVLFDTVTGEHLRAVGRVLGQLAESGSGFVVGSSGVENALCDYWQANDLVQRPAPITPPQPVDQLLVMSGSASPVTAEQIEWAFARGFKGLRIDVPRLIDPAQCDGERDRIINEARAILNSGASLIIYSALGPADEALAETRAALDRMAIDQQQIAVLLGGQQGVIVKQLLQQTRLRRVCVAGGDTSGHAALQLGIYALEMRTPIAPGAPLCLAYSEHAEFNGIEISLKGGQNGKADYFGAILRGHS